MRRLYFGGFELRFFGAHAEKAVNPASPFLRPERVLTREAVEVHCRAEPLPASRLAAWARFPSLIDTLSTWAVARTDSADFPYRFFPSSAHSYPPGTLHLLASRDFRRLEIYYGGWDNPTPDLHHFYPFEQMILAHFLQASGRAAIVHAAGLSLGGRGALFLGDSGAGKSTIAGLLEDSGLVDEVFSDDRIIVREHEGRWWMFGTPWHGTLPRISPGSREIGGMFFLEQSRALARERLGPKAAFARQLPVTFGSWWLPERTGELLSFVRRMAAQDSHPLFRLEFPQSPAVADFVREALGEGENTRDQPGAAREARASP